MKVLLPLQIAVLVQLTASCGSTTQEDYAGPASGRDVSWSTREAVQEKGRAEKTDVKPLSSDRFSD
ncbi:hypothetical protein [Luteolibacter luteus]|uniref:Lipoprotein n=1 Tax=Luteolibacter luteus TaxID=2728835 RepID=A0A858RJI6_9BACT|nr:hypothetical protein [Luteolibacter luteus]QJE96674.1 hypothetical protein HHL09_13065 [Luteolibacter luteus]